MKIIQLFFSILAISLCSCNKTDDFNYPEGTVGVSKIIYYPSVKTSGDKFIILKQGDSYTDAGADATLNGESVDYATDVTVNTAVPGVYNLTYSAVNSQGYSATDWRTVVVIGNDVASNNFSGTYLRAATGVTSTWTKIADGVYMVENPGGAGTGAGLTVTLVNYMGSSITIPRQISADFGEVSSEQETYSSATGKVSYIYHAGGYGTALRTFTKQ